MISKTNRPKKFGLLGEQNLLESLKKCKAEGKQIYSTMSEIKAAFPGRTIRSLKNIVYRSLEEN